MLIPLRLLLVEEKLSDVELILSKLRLAGYEPIWQRVETAADYAAYLDTNLDLILADFVSPELNPAQALKLLQARGLDIPLIVVTDKMTDESTAEYMKQGAADYLLKDRLARLGEATHRALQQRRSQMEQRRAEDKLQMLQRAVEQSASSVIITDLQGNIEYVNPYFTVLTGYTAEEVVGKNPRILKSGETSPQIYEQLWITLLAGGEWRGELHNRKKNGELFWELASIAAMKDTQGRIAHFIAVKEDITERKRAQETLLKAELLRVELGKEREIIDLKHRFVSLVSHDLRTPLTVISGSLQVFRRYFDRLSPEERHHQLSIIDTQVKHMAELFDDILALATAQAGKLDFKPSPLDLEAFCRDVFQQMQLTDTVGHQFIFVAEGDLAHVSMDAKILRHILINLLSNAIKYSPDGGEVRLALSVIEQEAMLRISDQGIGIPEKDQARIFEAFHRAENARPFAGSGLGLAIVKSNVEVHGGTIRFESRQGKGTTFIVRLPLGV